MYIYIYTFVHILVRHKSLSWQEDMFITTDPPMNHEPTEIDAETTSQAVWSAFLHFLEQNTHPKVRTIHEHLAAGHYLWKNVSEASEKLWETCLKIPNEFGEKGPYPKDKYRLSRCPVKSNLEIILRDVSWTKKTSRWNYKAKEDSERFKYKNTSHIESFNC